MEASKEVAFGRENVAKSGCWKESQTRQRLGPANHPFFLCEIVFHWQEIKSEKCKGGQGESIGKGFWLRLSGI